MGILNIPFAKQCLLTFGQPAASQLWSNICGLKRLLRSALRLLLSLLILFTDLAARGGRGGGVEDPSGVRSRRFGSDAGSDAGRDSCMTGPVGGAGATLEAFSSVCSVSVQNLARFLLGSPQGGKSSRFLAQRTTC